MRVARRLAPLLVCALMAGVPAVAVAQGGAGDDQYQDPFAGSNGGDTGTGSGGGQSDGSSGQGGSSEGNSSGSDAGSPEPAQSAAPELTQDPALDSGTATAATPPAAESTGSATSRSELPRTGLDAPIVALLGIGLLAAGVGLRMRTVDGRPG